MPGTGARLEARPAARRYSHRVPLVQECALNLLAFVALLVAVVAWRRASAQGARLERLEAELRALRTGRPLPDAVEAAPRAEPWWTPSAAPATADAAAQAISPAPEVAAPASADSEASVPPTPETEVDSVPADPTGVPPPGEAGRPAGAPPGPREPPIDWERWIGVRGAAVLGGAVLALAGLYFFRYSVEHGLIPPWLRVVLGTLAGCGCVAAAELALRRAYAGTANAVAGAGVVILYAAFWAAANRYGLIGPGALFLLLAAVTVTAGVLSWRHGSLVIAVLGLVGGLLTPLVASSGSDRPVGLFAYLLLLDGAVLLVARRRGWPVLAVLALLGTAVWQAVWIGARMGAERLWLGLAILAVFVLAFAAAAPRPAREAARAWLVSQAAAVLLPFAFALYFASDAELGGRVLPLAALLLLLSATAGWLGRVHEAPWLATGAAAGVVAVFAAWLVQHEAATGFAWRIGVAAVLAAAAFHTVAELDRARAGTDGHGLAAMVAVLGLFAVLLVAAVASPGDVSSWSWLPGWLGLAALLVRHAVLPERGWLALAAAAGLALGLAGLRAAHAGAPGFPRDGAFVALVLAIALAFQGAAMVAPPGAARRWAEHAAALYAVVVLATAVGPIADQPVLVLLSAALLGVLALLAATRLGGGWWMVAAMAATALVQTAGGSEADGGPAIALPLQAATATVFLVWPFVAGPALRVDPRAWQAAALAPAAWFVSLGNLWEKRFGDAVIGLVPLALGAATLAAAWRARAAFPPDDPARVRVLAWFLGITTAFVTVAIPLQLEKSWITIGWALEGAALVLLWQRLDHPGLKWCALALLAAVTVRLVANAEVLGYHPRGPWRLLNWLAYTYLVPAAALLFASARLEAHELVRVRAWERPVYRRGHPLGALAAGLGGLVVLFAWLNLAIADWYAVGPALDLSLERMPARDLTTSIVWALYAIALLALGVWRASVGLRWVSLGLMMVTIGKVFLYDLGELRDLYRVASLLGLALSLIVVSLAYQRFVLRRTPPG